MELAPEFFSVLAAKLGASKCIAVDVDDDCIRAASNNARFNKVDNIIDVIHTRTVYIGDNSFRKLWTREFRHTAIFSVK